MYLYSFVRYCMAQYIKILFYCCTTELNVHTTFGKITQYKGEWYYLYHLQVQYWSLSITSTVPEFVLRVGHSTVLVEPDA
jgi:hypothetical protein